MMAMLDAGFAAGRFQRYRYHAAADDELPSARGKRRITRLDAGASMPHADAALQYFEARVISGPSILSTCGRQRA